MVFTLPNFPAWAASLLAIGCTAVSDFGAAFIAAKKGRGFDRCPPLAILGGYGARARNAKKEAELVQAYSPLSLIRLRSINCLPSRRCWRASGARCCSESFNRWRKSALRPRIWRDFACCAGLPGCRPVCRSHSPDGICLVSNSLRAAFE